MPTTGDRPFVLVEHSALPPDRAWARVTEWEAHAAYVPLTRIDVTTPPPTGVGTRFSARTSLGPLAFVDVMEVTVWEPPTGNRAGRCRLEKRARAIRGWAEITVRSEGTGSRVTWVEAARPLGLPRAATPLNNLAGSVLFGRVLRGLLAR